MIKILLVEDDLGLSNSVFDFLDDFAKLQVEFVTHDWHFPQRTVASACSQAGA